MCKYIHFSLYIYRYIYFVGWWPLTHQRPRFFFKILLYGLGIILCIRAHLVTEPTCVGPALIEPRARGQGPRSCGVLPWWMQNRRTHIYIYIYIYIHIYTYICIHISLSICIYVYIYIEREREIVLSI